jgi:hypothetical protein
MTYSLIYRASQTPGHIGEAHYYRLPGVELAFKATMSARTKYDSATLLVYKIQADEAVSAVESLQKIISKIAYPQRADTGFEKRPGKMRHYDHLVVSDARPQTRRIFRTMKVFFPLEYYETNPQAFQLLDDLKAKIQEGRLECGWAGSKDSDRSTAIHFTLRASQGEMRRRMDFRCIKDVINKCIAILGNPPCANVWDDYQARPFDVQGTISLNSPQEASDIIRSKPTYTVGTTTYELSGCRLSYYVQPTTCMTLLADTSVVPGNHDGGQEKVINEFDEAFNLARGTKATVSDCRWLKTSSHFACEPSSFELMNALCLCELPDGVFFAPAYLLNNHHANYARKLVKAYHERQKAAAEELLVRSQPDEMGVVRFLPPSSDYIVPALVVPPRRVTEVYECPDPSNILPPDVLLRTHKLILEKKLKGYASASAHGRLNPVKVILERQLKVVEDKLDEYARVHGATSGITSTSQAEGSILLSRAVDVDKGVPACSEREAEGWNNRAKVRG